MRRPIQEDDNLFPNFAGYADLMSVLCLLFIIVAAILLVQNRAQLLSLGKEKATNRDINLEYQKLLKLRDSLQKEVASVPKKYIIPNELDGKVFFKTGEATIQSEFYNSLNTYANEILIELRTGNFNFVQIEGHTDKHPIATFRFQDNWELGAARAIAVVRYFIKRGISAEQLSAVSHGEFKPNDLGESPDAYGNNRRIEITLLKK
jgi:flagellar motor protein MotB